ncbi:LOW QUALITY PROTEIN: hypothetical protein ACHAW6_008031 [Cyclotella cf. meneghiniana]
MQGHPESHCLWEKHINKLLRTIVGLTPTVHEPCLYCCPLMYVIFKCQVDDLAIATTSKCIVVSIVDLIDKKLCMPMHHLGRIVIYIGLNVMQLGYFVKISIKTWLTFSLVPYL